MGIIENFYVLKSKDAMKRANAYVVTTTADVVDPRDGETSLREAALWATSRDTVVFSPSLKNKTITLSGTEIRLVNGVTIDASSLMNADGTPGITLDAGGKSRVFYVSGGTESDPATLSGLTITNGSANYGGGVYVNSNASATFADCSISVNKAASGGGLRITGAATLANCLISDNTATTNGGVYVSSGNATLTNCAVNARPARALGRLPERRTRISKPLRLMTLRRTSRTNAGVARKTLSAPPIGRRAASRR